MKQAMLYLWRHPRRTGFLIFNLVAVLALFVWAQFTSDMTHKGITAVPNIMLGYTGMALMVAVLIGGWIAWAVMVTSRHARHAAAPADKNRAV
jgi:protein-S-isoprenylcysteine O-methyltransferase Ste14